MTEEKSLISFAIISTAWHEEKKDYLDMFIPFCMQCLEEQRGDNEIISIKRLKESLRENFGINLPSNVVEMIIRRLSNQKYIRIKKNVCYFTDKKADTKSFKEKSLIAERHQRELFQGICEFLKEHYPTFQFEKELLEDAFIQYLSKYGRGIIASSNKLIQAEEQKDELYNYYIGIFISYAKENDERFFSYIEEIVHGAMYASALHMQHNLKRIQINSRIENLKVFLDTPLLLHLLGYSGDELKESITELINILKNLGVEICYWQHNIDELVSILEAYEQHYNNGTLEKSRNFEYLVLQKTTPADISRYKATLASDLRNKEINLEPNVNLSMEEFGESAAFEDYLKRNMHYRFDTRRMNDVNSICFTYHIRTRKDFRRIENCEAVFVTQNYTLASLTKKYFKENRNPDEYPAIIDDTLLTSIAWLKSETDGDKILNSKIIADAWAAQSVPDMFWEKCVEEMEKLQKHGEISQEQIYQLEYDFLAKRQLYEKTDGDATKLNMGDIEQVLQQVEYNRHQELLKENEALTSMNANAVSETSDLSQRLIDSKVKEYTHSISYWMLFAILRKCLLLVICVILVAISQVISYLQIQQPSWESGIGAVLIGVIIKYIDKFISAKRNSISNWLLEKAKIALREKVNSREDKFADEIIEKVISHSRWFK